METNGNLTTKEIFVTEQDNEQTTGSVGLFHWLAGSGDFLPPWWSYARDEALRKFWKLEDHLAGTINTLREMMVAIPVKVVARDSTIKAHVRQAELYTNVLLKDSQSRSNMAETGWGTCYGSALQDFWTQDNGMVIAIEGPGRPDGPILGMPTKLIHLDAWRCYRTGSREYPIIYYDADGKRYKLHKSRVIVMASQASPVAEMCGVGFCAVSRAALAAQIMRDIATYKQEKLGSRQRRAVLVGDGIPTKAIEGALRIADEGMDNMGLKRFGKIPIIGSAKTGISLTLVDLASVPDGFNDLDQHQLGMHVLALAFGVDQRQLAWAQGLQGQTKADALVQHFKMRGKGPGFIISEVTRKLEAKFLPPHLKLIFDRQDDEQDEQQANIEKVRSETRERDINTGVISVRVAREMMVEEGGLTQQQFRQLELTDGRLEDGQPLHSIETNSRYAEFIGMEIADLYALLDTGGAAARLRLIRETIAYKEQAAKRTDEDNKPAAASDLSPSEIRSVMGVLSDIKDGKTSPALAQSLLESIGLSAERAKSMVDLALSGQPVEAITEQVAPEDVIKQKDSLDEVFAKYHQTVNMSASELERWADTDCSKKASLDRSPITRNLRLLRKAKSEWTPGDIRDANRTISFVSRMSGAEQGEPAVKGCPSKRDISLKNWAYNPDKKKELDRQITKQAAIIESELIAKAQLIEQLETKSQSTFRASIRAAIRSYWKGVFSQSEFEDAMESAITRGFRQAWLEGAKECGITSLDDLTDRETNALQSAILEQIPYIFNLAEDLNTEGKLGPLFDRSELWIKRYGEIRIKAKAYACADKPQEWILGKAEHCSSCLKLAGKVKRASYWVDSGILPRNAGAGYLECKGFNCDCDLVNTTKPISRGPLPSLP